MSSEYSHVELPAAQRAQALASNFGPVDLIFAAHYGWVLLRFCSKSQATYFRFPQVFPAVGTCSVLGNST